MQVIFRSLLIVFFCLSLFLLSAPLVYSSTLYTNDFTSNFQGFTTSFGTCQPTIDGLKCTPTASSTYNLEFQSMKCIGGDYILGNAGVHGNDLLFSDSNQDLNDLVLIKFKTGTNILLLYTSNGQMEGIWDTHIQTPSGRHSYSICNDSGVFSVYLDNKLIFSKNIPIFSGKYVGFQLEPSTILTKFYVADAFPTNNLVPLLKQTSPEWNNQVYDSAGRWTSGNLSIGRWGCAVTSAAMILRYYGYDELPDGSMLDPGTLNEWLKTQRDGYVGSGWINWLAVSRLSKKATEINHITEFEALEYNRVGGLLPNFESKLPVIFEESGHFFVGVEKEGNKIMINDPFYDRNSVFTSHAILSTGIYTPSNTDLSYMMLIYDPTFSVKIFNSANIQVGTEYLQNPIKDSAGFLLGKTHKIYLIQKPLDGKYKIQINSSKSQFLAIEGLLYDDQGEFEHLIFPKAFVGNIPTSVNINYTKEGGDTSLSSKIVTLDQIIAELEAASKAKLIHKGAYTPISALLKQGKKELDKKKPQLTKDILKAIQIQINAGLGTMIDDQYEDILKQDISAFLIQI